MRSKTTVGVVIAVVALSGARLEHLRASDNAQSAVREQAQVEVSSVTVEPKEVHTIEHKGRPVAIVTVQVAHGALASPETVSAAVGTYSTSPPIGVAAAYAPRMRTLRIPAGPMGAVTTSFAVDSVSIRGGAAATIIIFASLFNPSPGIRIAESFSPGDSRASLKVISP